MRIAISIGISFYRPIGVSLQPILQVFAFLQL